MTSELLQVLIRRSKHMGGSDTHDLLLGRFAREVSGVSVGFMLSALVSSCGLISLLNRN